MMFHGRDVALIIKPGLLKEYSWESLKDLLPHTSLKQIVIRVDDLIPASEPHEYNKKLVAKIWNVVTDEYYSIIDETKIFQCVESGMPMDMERHACTFNRINETDEMKNLKIQWLLQPRSSVMETSYNFYKNFYGYCLARQKRESGKFNGTPTIFD